MTSKVQALGNAGAFSDPGATDLIARALEAFGMPLSDQNIPKAVASKVRGMVGCSRLCVEPWFIGSLYTQVTEAGSQRLDRLALKAGADWEVASSPNPTLA